MKVLIWLLTFIAGTIVNMWIGYAIGIKLGAILLYLVEYFIAKKLCKKWDERQEEKKRLENRRSSDQVQAIEMRNETLRNSYIGTKPASMPPLLQAVLITDIFEMSDHYGEFVKLQIDNLTNRDTFRLRFGNRYGVGSPDEDAVLLSKPIKELEYPTERGSLFVVIEADFPIKAKEYEDNHCIYGILRRREIEKYVLTSAFVVPSERNLKKIENQLKKQGFFEYSILDDGTVSVFDFVGKSMPDLTIPEMIDDKRVSAISDRAFYQNNDIKSVVIPDSISEIGNCAFGSCDNLERVHLGDGVKELNAAFEVCGKLKDVYIGKSVSKVRDPFFNCHSITQFEVAPENNCICAIDGVLFSKDKSVLVFCPCGKGGKYDIPYGTKIIGKGAFENTDLEDIHIPDSVEIIEDNAFSWASHLKKINIPSSVKNIAYGALSAGFGMDYEGEIVVKEGSFAQQYFKTSYSDGKFKLTVVGQTVQSSQLPSAIATQNLQHDDCCSELSEDKKCFSAVFVDHYKEMLKVAKTSPIAQNPEFELLPAMMVVADYAAMIAQKNRRLIYDEVIRAVEFINKEFNNSLLDERCELYGQIVRGRKLRGDWFLGNISELGDDVVLKCMVLLGDILYNPECADNYDTAPLIIRNISDTMEFVDSVMKPLLSEMVALFNDMLSDEIGMSADDSSVSDNNPRIKFCRKCGFKLIEGSEFCSRCGSRIEKEMDL